MPDANPRQSIDPRRMRWGSDKQAELYGRDPRARALGELAVDDPRNGNQDFAVALAAIYVGDQIAKLNETLNEVGKTIAWPTRA